MTTTTKNNSIMGYSKIKEVTFNGVTMLGIQTESGKVFTGIRKICEDLGIDFSSQLKKIKRDDILKEGVVILTLHRASPYGFLLQRFRKLLSPQA